MRVWILDFVHTVDFFSELWFVSRHAGRTHFLILWRLLRQKSTNLKVLTQVAGNLDNSIRYKSISHRHVILKTGFTSDSMASVPLKEDKLNSSTKPGTSLSLSLIFSLYNRLKDSQDNNKLTEKKKKSLKAFPKKYGENMK